MTRTRHVPGGIWARALNAAMQSNQHLRTQTALAKKSGVGQSTIGRILRGDVSPNAETLVRIAHAFRTPIATFIATAEPVRDDDDAFQDQIANLGRANWADEPVKRNTR
jgi:transcriptional regulator with XRE-family HTH domain